MMMQSRDMVLPDGRTVDVLVAGATSGPALVLHHGTPSDATVWHDWAEIAAANDFQLLCISRPGYAGSTRQPGRRVADVADDIAAVLAQISAPWFVTAGWSGGGPHALACAALVPGCRAAATLAGVGPYDAAGLDFLAGMGPENIDEFGAALKGEAALRAWLERNAEAIRTVTGAELIAAYGGLVSQPDKDVLVGGFADAMAAEMRRALGPGFDGWIDDDLAFTRPWGVDLTTLHVPVTVWQGELDLMVPSAHGRWLAANVPRAQARMVRGHGHISLIAGYRSEIIHDLFARSTTSLDGTRA